MKIIKLISSWFTGKPQPVLRSVSSKGSKPKLKRKLGVAAQPQVGLGSDTKTALSELPSLTFFTAMEGFYQRLFQTDIALPDVPRISVELKKRLQNPQERQKIVPRLPAVIPKLMRSLRDPDASTKDYLELIKKDPLLLAAVLKQANSVAYKTQRNEPVDIEQAVVKVGIDGLRQVLSSAVMKPMIATSNSAFNGFGEKLWEHSLRCAYLCEILAPKHNMVPYHGYLLGLTHSMGHITLFNEVCKLLPVKKVQSEQFRAELLLNPILAYGEELSFLIAESWELPSEVCDGLKIWGDRSKDTMASSSSSLLFQCIYISHAFSFLRDEPKLLEASFKELEEAWGLPKGVTSQLEQISL